MDLIHHQQDGYKVHIGTLVIAVFIRRTGLAEYSDDHNS